MTETGIRIVYMGTPEFAVAPLKALISAGISVEAVVTVPDKPAGRGQKVKPSPVKQFALDHHLPVLQPDRLREEGFLEILHNIGADMFVVVAFRKLPPEVWSIPPMGTFNLHASLLPDYRGAAPIHRAVMNGDKTTGLTTFLIREEIDAGEILMQLPMSIREDETTGSLHDRMMEAGGGLVVDTVRGLVSGSLQPKEQLLVNPGKMRFAPKILKEDCRIVWDRDVRSVYNQIRGLSPHPAAFCSMRMPDATLTTLKIYHSAIVGETSGLPGTLHTDDKTFLEVCCREGRLRLLEIQMEGRKRMDIASFLRGSHIPPGTCLV